MAIREEEVRAATAMLRHESLARAPLSQKVQFLEQKGLSSREIMQALESSKSPTVPTGVPPMAALSQSTWGEFALSAVFVAGVGALAYYLAHKIFPDPKPIPLPATHEEALESYDDEALTDGVDEAPPEKEPSLEGVSKAVLDGEKSAEPVAAAPTSLFDKLQRVADVMEKQSQVLQKLIDSKLDAPHNHTSDSKSSTVEQATESPTSASADAASIPTPEGAGLLTNSPDNPKAREARKPLPSSAVNSLISDLRNSQTRTEENTSEHQKVALAEIDLLQQADQDSTVSPEYIKTQAELQIHEAVATMVNCNAGEKIQSGASMLCMYITNLINNPNVPRYRRFSCTNQSFRKCVGELSSHAGVLEALGFRKSGTYYEWGWYADKENPQMWDVRQSLLKSTLSILEELKSSGALPAFESVQIHADADTLDNDHHEPASLPHTFTSVNSEDVTQANVQDTHTSVNSEDFKSPYFPLTHSHLAVNEHPFHSQQDKIGTSDVENPFGGLISAATSSPVFVSAQIDKQALAPPSALQSYGTSEFTLTEVADMVGRGETPPGIVTVDEKLSVDTDHVTLPHAHPAPPKPWAIRR